MRKERIASGAGGRLQNNPSFYVFSKSWKWWLQEIRLLLPMLASQLLKSAFAHPDFVCLNIMGFNFVISFL